MVQWLSLSRTNKEGTGSNPSWGLSVWSYGFSCFSPQFKDMQVHRLNGDSKFPVGVMVCVHVSAL